MPSTAGKQKISQQGAGQGKLETCDADYKTIHIHNGTLIGS
ncbi:hypothetical protein M5D96_008628 [Drosophila gunungcola]|uniref:Uncharacterized protein n=1 Tax=Drosophila gunungcola TaxID=103775 RepID=A0A9Q0BP42_9MUSC|nr:hypothetical protein M5D96_008628 [Drosophila gunungcola]